MDTGFLFASMPYTILFTAVMFLLSLDTMISLRASHPLNAEPGNTVTVEGISTFASLVQFANAEEPKVTLEPPSLKVTESAPEHPSNALLPIFLVLAGMSMRMSEEQFLNADAPISSTMMFLP